MKGSDVRRIRRRLGMRQMEFSKELGVSESQVSKLETGRAKMSVALQEKILKLFGNQCGESRMRTRGEGK